MPVGKIVGDLHVRERVLERKDFPAGHPLLHPREEPVVHILLDPLQALVVVEVVEWHVAGQSEGPERPPEPDERLIKKECSCGRYQPPCRG